MHVVIRTSHSEGHISGALKPVRDHLLDELRDYFNQIKPEIVKVSEHNIEPTVYTPRVPGSCFIRLHVVYLKQCSSQQETHLCTKLLYQL